jgi:hypothetical protein
VEGCTACRAELAALVGTDETVRGAVFALAEAAPPADYFDGLADRIAARLDEPDVIPIAAAAVKPREVTPKGAGRLGWLLGGLAAVSGAVGTFLFITLHRGAGARQDTAVAPPPGQAPRSPAAAEEVKAAPPEEPAPMATPAPAPKQEEKPKSVAAPAPAAPPADKMADQPVDKPADKPAAKPAKPAEDRVERDVARCWQKFQQKGTVVVKVTVAEDGSVTDVTPEGTLGSTPSGKCVAEAVRQGHFADRGPGTFRVTFTLPKQ